MTERLPCKTPECKATILPTTALKTGGFCMPCQQKKLALEKEAYILRNRKDIDRYAGIVDPVEVLKIMHTPRQHNPLENDLPYHKSLQELYHQLTEAEWDRMETYAITLMNKEDFDLAEDILLSLVCYTGAQIERGLNALFHNAKYYPGILYKDGSSHIRDKLIRKLNDDEANHHHLLIALAWIGDEEVVRLFAEWSHTPPFWASKLAVPPSIYAHEAGWELDDAGHKRLLFYPDSYHFKVNNIEGDKSDHPSVVALQMDEQACPWCGNKLIVLFDYNLQDPLIQFMNLPGRQLRIGACMHCNCYDTVFMKVELDGSYSWSEYNITPDFLPEAEPDEELQMSALRLSGELMDPYEGAFWMLETSISKIGGAPAWVQDTDYPSCPCCSKTMMFIGQIDMEQVSDGEGIYFTFLCVDCLISAVNYQQT